MVMLLMLVKLNTKENSKLRPQSSRGGAPPASVPTKHRSKFKMAVVKWRCSSCIHSNLTPKKIQDGGRSRTMAVAHPASILAKNRSKFKMAVVKWRCFSCFSN
jgi:hypothetical protein